MSSKNNLCRELVVDNFAGGGGASTGIELAIGRSVDIAINHDPAAVAMHKVNHPDTLHYCESVWNVDPRKATNGRPVALAWFSPDCKYFSKAKGGKPVDRYIRGLSWVILRWALDVSPRVIMLENVEEIQGWGPLIADTFGNEHPDPHRKGETFSGFVAMMTTGIEPGHPALIEACEFLGINSNGEKAKRLIKGLGYDGSGRELVAANYGAPTLRKRYFHIFRNDGLPIVWPKSTHGKPGSLEVNAGKLKPWRTAAEIIDFNIPCPSIFDTSDGIKRKYGLKAVRPLAAKTMKRIAKGLDKFFIKNPEPYIIQVNHGGENFRGQSIHEPISTITGKLGYGVVSPTLLQYHDSQDARGQTVDQPIMTIDSSPRYALISAYLIKYYGQGIGQQVTEPLHTITSKDRSGLSVAHIVKFKGDNKGQTLKEPLQTITTSAGQFGLVRTYLTKIDSNKDLGYWPEVRSMLNEHCGYCISNDEILIIEIRGEKYFISDIGLRMLIPRELFNANGFPPEYIIDHDYSGISYPKSEQVARCGNAVPPQLPDNLVKVNLPELCVNGGQKWSERPVKAQMSLF